MFADKPLNRSDPQTYCRPPRCRGVNTLPHGFGSSFRDCRGDTDNRVKSPKHRTRPRAPRPTPTKPRSHTQITQIRSPGQASRVDGEWSIYLSHTARPAEEAAAHRGPSRSAWSSPTSAPSLDNLYPSRYCSPPSAMPCSLQRPTRVSRNLRKPDVTVDTVRLGA